MIVDERKQRILQAIIEDFILSNTPVGSRTLCKTSGLGVSSATIRNEMADLEEMGYLIQPHVSAGRVPSDKAYRLYVSGLMRGGLTEAERERIRAYFTSRVHDMEDVSTLCAQTLSELTHYTALVMTPRQSDQKVEGLHLVPVGRDRALLIVVTDSGAVRDTVIRVSDRLGAEGLFTIGRMLTERLRGLTLRQVREMLYGYAAGSDADARVLSGVAALAGQMEKQTEHDRVAVGGAHNILYYPEYADVSRARAFMDALERGDELIALLRRAEKGVNVFIGPECGISEFGDCSVVCAPYQVGRGHTGAIAVVGPTRMPYAKMMETIDLIAGELSGMLALRG